MLDDYQKIQPIVYKILRNAVSKDKYSHAYLFETNGCYDSYKLVLAFIKSVLWCSYSCNDFNNIYC